MSDEFDVIYDLQRKFQAAPRSLSFAGSSRDDWEEWRDALKNKLAELMAPWPLRTRLSTRQEGELLECAGFSAQRLSWQVEPGLRATGWLLVPDTPLAGTKGLSPGLIALHGHGKSASHGVAGNPLALPGLDEEIAALHYDYGAQAARLGYYVIAPDARGWGDREPVFASNWPGRDGCNVAFLMASLTGWNLQTLNTSDDMRALDVLADLPDVDSEHLGVVGLSFGGTRALYLAALDKRIRVAVIAGYLALFEVYAMAQANFCGSQFVPGIAAWCELPDLFGLIAPRPLMAQSGDADSGFLLEAAHTAASQVRKIYAAAGFEEHFEHVVFKGGHQFEENSAWEFVAQWLNQ